MPYFECTGCGGMVNLETLETTERRQHCPVCEEQTTWEVAFESESGVSF